MILRYVLIVRAYVILRKKSVREKMTSGGPSALLSVRFSLSRSAKASKLSFRNACQAALEDVDSGWHYSIPLEIIAEKLEAASDDGKQPEDSKPVGNGTLPEDSKPADVPTNDSKLLEEGKPVDADSPLPIHEEES